MLSKKMEKALNQQINREMFSSYLYLAMSAHLEDVHLLGMAKWMRVQAQEEMSHAMKLFSYMQERGAKPDLRAIEEPQKEWASPLALFEASLAHEQFITKSIHEIVDLAAAEKDHATNIFLHWFVTEQVEEESSLDPIIHRLRIGGEIIPALYALDRELGMRASK
jgi:ferritin